MSIYTHLDSPVGRLTLTMDRDQLTSIRFEGGPTPQGHYHTTPFHEVIAQLEAYFAGELRAFELPLAPKGTAFQLTVWEALLQIPYGETVSYGDIAQAIGKPTATRAVGAANGKNPLPIVVPCHRVIGSDGTLTGYGGGLSIKATLLELEKRHLSQEVAQ